jgi:hypothetical protein
MIPLSEISMGVSAVGAYSDHFCAEILERFVGVSKAASLGCTALSEVFRIEIDDYAVLPKEIRQGNVTASAGWQSEIRCDITNTEQLLHFRRSFYGLEEKRLSLVNELGKG